MPGTQIIRKGALLRNENIFRLVAQLNMRQNGNFNAKLNITIHYITSTTDEVKIFDRFK